MTRFILIRHAAVDWPADLIAGRSPGVHLAAAGRVQAQRLVGHLARQEIRAIYSSPRERARATAQIIGDERRLPVQIAPELDEIDYGDWTGSSIEELKSRPRWQAFNWIRSCTRIPGGELVLEVQARIVRMIDRLNSQDGPGSVVLVSHGDVIRAALAYYLSLPLDLMLRLEINPASISIVDFKNEAPTITCVNYVEDLP